jgi:hypothetical protein
MVGFWYIAVNVKFRAEPSGQGVVGIARLVGASQACHSATRFGELLRPFGIRSAVTARNEEVFYGGPSGSATRCNVQCERDGALEALVAIEAQIARLDQQLKELARRSGETFLETRNSGIPACLLPGDHQLHMKMIPTEPFR